MLATHNPDVAFLSEFIDSLALQSNLEFDLVWNDDGSDEAHYQKAYKVITDKFNCTATKHTFNSARDNFMFMLTKHNAYEYIFFADQDDIWCPNRISEQIVHFNTLHPDSELPGGNYFQPIIFNYEREWNVHKESAKFQTLLIHNMVQGCTLMINGAAARKITGKDYSVAIMHDWWISLYLSGLGHLYFLNRSLIKYRIHEINLIGIPSKYKKIKLLLTRGGGVLIKQNYSFHNNFSSEISKSNELELTRWLQSYNKGSIQRIKAIFTDIRRRESFFLELIRRLQHGIKRP